MKKKIKFEEIQKLLEGKSYSFPKFTTLLLNLANRYSRGTRPENVGQMSELIQEFEGNSLEEWREWYSNQHPDAKDKAADLIEDHVQILKDALGKIDREMIEKWVDELVIVKTYTGLKFQQAILAKVAELCNTTFSQSGIQDERKNIDGLVGDQPVSIKPKSFKEEPSFIESIEVPIIFYKKYSDGITIEYNESDICA